jgi:NAD(P)-dependent dehydrogenase (short-subunit alcohol dehydrogenase family)
MEPPMTHPALVADRTTIITGGASGIGRAAASALAARGMSVALLDLPGSRLDEAAEALRAAGARVLPIGLDVADRPAVEAAARRIEAELPPATVALNIAGIGMPSSTLGAAEAWRRTFDVNLWGVVNGTQAFVPLLSAHGEAAVIVNAGSKQGITTPPGNPAYNASKAAVKAFTEALAHELRNREGGRVTAHLLIPGWVHTGMTAADPGAPKPAGAWSAEETVAFLLDRLEAGDFYILCPDNDTPRALDEARITWAAGDLVENRPALSRWHPDWAEAFRAFVAGR